MGEDPDIFDRALLRRRRNRTAAGLNQHDFLIAGVAKDLLERLTIVRRRFPVVVDLGAHHGLLGAQLRSLVGVEMVIAVEPVEGLIRQCRGLRVQADAEALPFRSQSLDLVVSALALQLVNDLPGTLAQVRQALRPDGLLLAAMLAGNTLHELRTALYLAEEEVEGGASPRVAPFADIRQLGSLLVRAGFTLPVADTQTLTVTYPNALALMRELRATGVANNLRARRRKPLRRETLARALQHYAERFGLPGGRVPATFEIVTLTGWAPHHTQQQPLRPGSATARLAEVLAPAAAPTGRAGPDETAA
ncbi:MAG: methyltransferase domain-containing protein [Hyphomicrobiaceae bacterium]